MAEGFKIADAFVEVEARLDRAAFQRQLEDVVVRAQPRVEHVSRNRLGRTMGNSMLSGVADAFSTGLIKTLSVGFAGSGSLATALASNPITATIGVAVGGAIATAAVGAIATVLTSGLALLAGAAVLGIGIAIASQNKKIQKQWEKSWGSIQKTLQKTIQPLIKPLIEAMISLDEIVRDLRPEMTALFRSVAPLLRVITDALGPTLREVIVGLTDAMPGIKAAFEGLGAALPRIGKAVGDFFRTIFQDKDLIRRMTEGLGDFIAGLITWSGKLIRFFAILWGAFTNFATLFKSALSGDLLNALAGFETFTGGALGRIVNAWAPLRKAIGEIWDALVKFANADNELEMSKAYVTLVEKIKAAWVPLKAFIGVVWDEILAAIKKWWNDKVMPWWENTAKPWLIEKIKGMAKAAFEWLKTEALNKAKEVPGKILEGIKNLANTVKADIVRQFASAGNWLLAAGKSILQGLIDGIASKIKDLKNLLSSVTGLIPDWKGPMEKDKKLLVPTGKAIMGGLQSGMESQLSSLQKSLGGLTAAIPDMAAAGRTSAPAGLTISFAGANFYGVPDRTFIATLYDLLNRYEKGYVR
jgi:hypothetical protein